MTAATLSGLPATRVRLHVPAVGVWWADVELASDSELSGSVSLVLSDSTYTGTVKSGGVVYGRARYRIAGGAGGWANTLSALGYTNDMGVKRAAVAQDAADACGETLDTSGLSGTMGPHFFRANGAAYEVLEAVAPRSWYVGADGVTYFGSRASSEVDDTITIVRREPEMGMLVLAPSEISNMAPGAIVDGVTAVDVRHELDPETGLRTTVWGASSGLSRNREALRRLVRAALPELRWLGSYEYRVISQSGDRLTMQPVRSSLGLPDIGSMRVRPGVPGASADVSAGALVIVAFIDADPSRPAVVAFDDPDSPGFLPSELRLNATSSVVVGADADLVELGSGDEVIVAPASNGRVVRYGDTVTLPAGGGVLNPAGLVARVSA